MSQICIWTKNIRKSFRRVGIWGAYPDLFILGTSGKVFAIRAEADTSNIKIASLGGFLVWQDTIFQNGQKKVRLRWNERSYHVFAPVFVSKIWAVRLQPVARYLPSGENRTQHTTLRSQSQYHKAFLNIRWRTSREWKYGGEKHPSSSSARQHQLRSWFHL